MKKHFSCPLIFGFILFFSACTPETESHTVTTPGLKLNAAGPMFEGPNTATAGWEFQLSGLLENTGKKDLRSARIQELQVTTPADANFPGIDKMVLEMKSKNTSMHRIGLLENSIKPGKTYTFKVAEQQKEVLEALKDEKITFVGDFELLEEEYYDDIEFELQVTLQLNVKK